MKPAQAAWLAIGLVASGVAHAQARSTFPWAPDCRGASEHLCRYHADNLALAVRPQSERQVVLIGDSLTEGWPATHTGLPPEGVVNRGIAGETLRQMRARFASDVLALRPSVVHIMGGTNDIARNEGKRSQSAMRADISAMARDAKGKGIAVVLATLPPVTRFPWAPELKPAGAVRSLNAWIRTHAKRNGYQLADYFSVLATADGDLNPAYTDDGVHLNAAGYAAIEPITRRAMLDAARR